MHPQRRYIVFYFSWLLLACWIVRVLFFFRYWYPATTGSLAKVFWWGLRFDFSILFFLQLPLILYWMMIYPRGGKFSRLLLFVGYMVINLFVFAINLLDLVYFGFNNRRSTADLLYVMVDGWVANRAGFGQYIWLMLLWLVFAFVSFGLLRRMLATEINAQKKKSAGLLWFAATIAACWLFATNQDFRPLTPPDALLHMETSEVPLAENSAGTFLYTLVKRQKELRPVALADEAGIDSLFNIRRQYAQTERFRRMNVVLFILESFSSAVIDSGSPSKAFTPFIDSIRRQSIDCSNGLANGLESNKGIVALLGSMPPLLEEPFYYSSYNTVPFRGIGTILKDSGYQTAFFMGASPDHFGFGKWCRMIGVDHYYSENEYGQRSDYDGHWGIFDHKFLPYAAGVLAHTQRPFFATVFNISTHPPFALPETMSKQFSIPGQTARQNSISYTDYALRLFFDQIKNEPWYRNTLFVFAADHVLLERRNVRSDLYNYMRIPIFLHLPGNPRHIVLDQPVQQLDIVPTILDLLHYNQPFMSFGNSMLRPHPGFSVCRIFDTDQMVDSMFITGYQPAQDSVLYFYNYRADTALAKNFSMNPSVRDELLQRKNFLRAFGQKFNQALLRRQLFIQ